MNLGIGVGGESSLGSMPDIHRMRSIAHHKTIGLACVRAGAKARSEERVSFPDFKRADALASAPRTVSTISGALAARALAGYIASDRLGAWSARAALIRARAIGEAEG